LGAAVAVVAAALTTETIIITNNNNARYRFILYHSFMLPAALMTAVFYK
jgi:hypothetical protein